MANTENAGSTADVPPVRYRVSGMDCAKDAAQIERAALGQLAEYTTCVDGQRITIKRALAEGAAPPPPRASPQKK